VPLVDPITGKALNEKAQAFYDRTMARIEQLQGGAGSPGGAESALGAAVTGAVPTDQNAPVAGAGAFPVAQPGGLAAAINATPAPARIPPAGGRVNPAGAPGFGSGAGIAARIMAEQARPAGKVRMIAPDGTEYDVDASEADEAQRNGWRLK
jgi:hypothetical protein